MKFKDEVSETLIGEDVFYGGFKNSNLEIMKILAVSRTLNPSSINYEVWANI